MTDDDLLDRLAQLDAEGEALDGAWECYADTMAEHRGEVARFGDSWPGAAVQLADTRASLERGEAEYREMVAELDRHFPVLGPPAPTYAPSEEDPFWT